MMFFSKRTVVQSKRKDFVDIQCQCLEDGTISFLNAGFRKILGLQVKESCGQSLGRIIPDAVEYQRKIKPEKWESETVPNLYYYSFLFFNGSSWMFHLNHRPVEGKEKELSEFLIQGKAYRIDGCLSEDETEMQLQFKNTDQLARSRKSIAKSKQKSEGSRKTQKVDFKLKKRNGSN